MFSELNEYQKQVASFDKGNAVVLSFAGSGKTKTMLERVIKLLEDKKAKQHEILLISFTKETVNDMIKRLGKNYADVNVKTFHSLCLGVLREYQEMGILFKRDWKFDKHFEDVFGISDELDEIVSWISYQKNYGFGCNSKTFAEKEQTTISERELVMYYKEYEKYLDSNNMYDFDDMLLMFVKLVNKNKTLFNALHKKYKYVMVDEHQDSNSIQNDILKIFCGNGNLMCIGDHNQSLYRWRGASPELIINFCEEWDNAKIMYLPTNYRSTKDIVDLANRFIKQSNEDSKLGHVDCQAYNQSDGVIHINYHNSPSYEIKRLIEEEGVEPKDIAILYRSHYLSAQYEEELTEMDIPFTVIGQDRGFFYKTEIMDMLSYLQLSVDKENSDAFIRVYNKPNRYLSKVFCNLILSKGGDLLSQTLRGFKPYEIKGYNNLKSIVQSIENSKPDNAIKSVMKAIDFESTYKVGKGDVSDRLHSMNSLIKLASKFKTTKQFLYAVEQIKKKPKEENAVTMMSVHGSKGLEFNHVFLVDVNDNVFPDVRSTDEDERRILYVAITRPKLSLYVYGNSYYVSELQQLLHSK